MKIKKINRIKRFWEIFKRIKFSTGAWWLKLGKGHERSILSDFDAYYFGKVKLFFIKIRVAWLLSWDLLITKDGVYRILKEDKNEMSLYKERFLL
jgi:hypothetical protein